MSTPLAPHSHLSGADSDRTRDPDTSELLTTPPSGAVPTCYAVYGTLMAGQPNRRVVDGLGDHGAYVTIPNADLYSVHGAFPALLPGMGTVRAQLWRPFPGCEALALERLDGLEGCRGETGMYVRRQLQLGDGTEATVYVWNRPAPPVRIPSGDWARWREAQRAQRWADDPPARRAWQGWH